MSDRFEIGERGDDLTIVLERRADGGVIIEATLSLDDSAEDEFHCQVAQAQLSPAELLRLRLWIAGAAAA